MIHQEPVINALSDRDSILPHVITSIGSPMPIKLKVASEIIAVLTFMTTINIMDEKKFGTRCFHKIRKNPAPIHLAAMIYSLFRICVPLCVLLRNTGPAGHTDHKGQTQDICISHNSLQQNDQEQSWYT